MAWQLIYTSAPRLLEAGRTGFGTVARHRGVSALVASAVERISQFARLSGLDSRRVIYSHRIVTVGAGQFHILSCIRDAGSDYTGRTNHLAHHLIAEAREVAALQGQGPSPADVLLQMNWAQSWTSAPRFFDPTEEVPLSGFSAEAQGSAWERITGRNDHAWLPVDPRMKRGCYIITPPAADARELFHDSLACLPGESWATTFTTSLEPNDEVADFRWIALPLGSPLRRQLDTSARTILNLTNPSTLPEPERVAESESRAVSPAIREPSVERLNRPVTSLPPPAAVETRSPILMATAMGTMGDWAPAPTKRKKPLFWVILGAGMLCALTIIGLSALSIIKDRREHRIAIERRAASDKIIKDVDDLLRGLRNLEVTKKWLKKPENTTEIESYAKIKSWITEQSSAPDQSKAPSAAKLQPDFRSYLDAFVGWRDEARTKSNRETLVVWRNSPPNQILSVTTEWLNDIEAKKSKVQYYGPTLPRLIEDNLSKAIQQKLGEIRTATSQPLGNAKEWDELLKFLVKKDIIKKGSDHDWIHDWVRLSDLSEKTYRAEPEKKEIRETASKVSIPWLKNLAQQLVVDVDKGMSDADRKKGAPATPIVEQKSSLDDPSASHNIQIEIAVQPKTGPSAGEASRPRIGPFAVEALRKWEKGAKVHLLVGEAGDSRDKLEKWSETLTPGLFARGKMSNADKAIRIEAGKLKLPQSSQQKSWRIVGESDSSEKALFELIVVPKESKIENEILSLNRTVTAQRKKGVGVLQIDGQTLSVLSRIQVPKDSNFILRAADADLILRSDGMLTAASESKESSDFKDEIKTHQENIDNFNLAIRRDQKEEKDTPPNLAGRDARINEIRARILKNQAQAELENNKINALQLASKQPQNTPKLESGLHAVFLRSNEQKFPLFRTDIVDQIANPRPQK